MSVKEEPLLEVKDLVTVFSAGGREIPAISDINFVLHRGETLGIVGESGSGKSVTSLSLMSLIPRPQSRIAGGEIRLFLENGVTEMISAGEDTVRSLRGRRIAMIFQEPMTSLNPVMRCGDQVTEVLLLHREMTSDEARKRVLELFSEVQLPDPTSVFSRYPHQLSGGQKQRVMIAMAISCDPDVLIADEPTTALDVTVQKTILELLASLQKKYGMGILFITHDLGVIAELADKVIVMYKGRVVEQAPVLDLFSDPRHPYTKSLLACRPPLASRPVRLPVVSDFVVTGADGTFITKEGPAVTVGTFTAAERAERMAFLEAAPALLDVRDLCTWFPSRRDFLGRTQEYLKAVDGVSLTVKEGETLGLVGESGCGKSTLGRSLLRLAPVRSGSVMYRGVDILTLSEHDFKAYRKKMQIIFQDPYSSLNPRVTIGEAITEPMRVHHLHGSERLRRQRSLELLGKVGLEKIHFGRYPHEFSGGQRQRICIARALAVEPEFLICDESVSALDVSVQAQVLNLLNDLRKELRLTCIFISHDLSVVKYMSDRMVVMQKGKVVEMGDSDQVYGSPSMPYTKKLISSIPDGSISHIREMIAARRA